LRLIAHARALIGNSEDPDMRSIAALLDLDTSLVLLGARDYAKALASLNSAVRQMSVANPAIANDPGVLLMRSAVLIGLDRRAEADVSLRLLEAGLDFDGRPPMCGLAWFFITPLNPYDAGRRIAAYYQRTGRQERAQHLLNTMEKSRAAVKAVDDLYPGSWAQASEDAPRGFDPYAATLRLPAAVHR
jgi:hypothetical protein